MTESPTAMNLLLVGCGRMGSALLSGWGDKMRGAVRVTVVDPVKPKTRHAMAFRWLESLATLPGSYMPEAVVLAVKPQSMDAVLKELAKRKGWEDTLYLSIAAGKDMEYFRYHLGAHALVVRVMPNTPALIGKAISGLYASAQVNEIGCEWAEKLMRAVGETVWLEEESQMDAFTAVAGSGPAYLYALIEALTQAGVDAGLAPAVAALAARTTIQGAAALSAQSEDAVEVLRGQVTSPGGTTEAALEVLLQRKGLHMLMSQAVQAAIKRAHAL
jgi:pyrroline-5-carboxylate reductase